MDVFYLSFKALESVFKKAWLRKHNKVANPLVLGFGIGFKKSGHRFRFFN